MASRLSARQLLWSTISAAAVMLGIVAVWVYADAPESTGSRLFEYRPGPCAELDLSRLDAFTGSDFPDWKSVPGASVIDSSEPSGVKWIECALIAEVSLEWCASHDSEACPEQGASVLPPVGDNRITMWITFHPDSDENRRPVDGYTDLVYHEVTEEFAYGSWPPESDDGPRAIAEYAVSNLRVQLQYDYDEFLYGGGFDDDLAEILRDLAEQVADRSRIPAT